MIRYLTGVVCVFLNAVVVMLVQDSQASAIEGMFVGMSLMVVNVLVFKAVSLGER